MVKSDKQVMEGLFSASNEALQTAKKKWEEVDAIFFCEGPGSTLGLRIACAFIRTIQWSNRSNLRLFRYNALDMANLLCNSPASIQAPFRRGFRFVRTGEEPIGRIEIFKTEEAGQLFPDSMHLPDPRNSQEEIPPDKKICYHLGDQIKNVREMLAICQECDEAIPYSPRPPEFKKWVPQ